MFDHGGMLLNQELSLCPCKVESLGCKTSAREHGFLRSIRVTRVEVVIGEEDAMELLDIVGERVPCVLLGMGEDTPE